MRFFSRKAQNLKPIIHLFKECKSWRGDTANLIQDHFMLALDIYIYCLGVHQLCFLLGNVITQEHGKEWLELSGCTSALYCPEPMQAVMYLWGLQLLEVVVVAICYEMGCKYTKEFFWIEDKMQNSVRSLPAAEALLPFSPCPLLSSPLSPFRNGSELLSNKLYQKIKE